MTYHLLFRSTAVPDCGPRRELPKPIPTILGHWFGCIDLPVGYRYPVLAELWESNRRGRAGFPHHPLVPE